MVVLFIYIALIIISMWIIYQKANMPGWASIVPVYNVIVFLKVIKKPWGWLFL